MTYSELIDKADLCNSHALNCESDWSVNFWRLTAKKLSYKAREKKLNETLKNKN